MVLQNKFDVRAILRATGIKIARGYEHKTSGEILCHCPYHNDEKPSFSVNLEKGVFNCFGCSAKGHISKLVEDFGLDTQNYLMFGEYEKQAQYKEKSKEISKVKDSFLNVYSNQEVMNYLRSRFVEDDFIKDFNIQYCEKETINDTRFEKRIIIPLIEDREIVGYEGRTYIKQNPKVLYPKDSKRDFLFNIDNLITEKQLILVEGLMDIPKIFSNITKNVTCTFGASITNKQLNQLYRFKDIVLIPDSDGAGIDWVLKIDDFLYPRYHEYKVAALDEGVVDPGDASLKEIKEALKEAKVAVDLLYEHRILNKNKK